MCWRRNWGNIWKLDNFFLMLRFEKIGTIQYFNRLNNNEIFYDDVGIGGTISHVTTEYINKIPEELKVNNGK